MLQTGLQLRHEVSKLWHNSWICGKHLWKSFLCDTNSHGLTCGILSIASYNPLGLHQAIEDYNLYQDSETLGCQKKLFEVKSLRNQDINISWQQLWWLELCSVHCWTNNMFILPLEDFDARSKKNRNHMLEADTWCNMQWLTPLDCHTADVAAFHAEGWREEAVPLNWGPRQGLRQCCFDQGQPKHIGKRVIGDQQPHATHGCHRVLVWILCGNAYLLWVLHWAHEVGLVSQHIILHTGGVLVSSEKRMQTFPVAT